MDVEIMVNVMNKWNDSGFPDEEGSGFSYEGKD